MNSIIHNRNNSINCHRYTSLDFKIISNDIDLPAADFLIQEQRGASGFVNVIATFERLVEPDLLSRIDRVSQHFLLAATVSIGTTQITMYSLLQRDDSGIVRSVFRSLGVE